MVFDTPRAEKLAIEYEDLPDDKVPEAVRLIRNPGRVDERSQIEQIMRHAEPSIQKTWARRLINRNDGETKGAWFEIMLYGWFHRFGEVTPEPNVEGDKPDFLVKHGETVYFVEANYIQKRNEVTSAEATRWIYPDCLANNTK